MLQAPGETAELEAEPPAPQLLLLIAPEPGFRTFWRNLRDLLQQPQTGPRPHESVPGDFWPDVFVDRSLPWRRFLQSAAYHALVLAMIWAGTRFLTLQPRVRTQPAFAHGDLIHYAPSEYLPPLDTRRAHTARARKSDPAYAQQTVISVPPEPSSHSQTVVTAPRIQLQHDIALPNVVAWSGKPQLPIGPAPLVPASQITRLAPQMEHSVIAPPQDVQTASRKLVQAPVPSVVAPPPAVEAGTSRRIADLNIATSAVIAPAPQLALDAQRALPLRSNALSRHAPGVIAPPPALSASAHSPSAGGVSGRNMIALNLHPAVGAPPDPPVGNRRGNFAATPEGHRGASGSPGETAGGGKEDTSPPARKSSGSMPSGLYVGKTANTRSPVAGDPAPKSASAYAVNPRLLANARPAPLTAHSLQSAADTKLSEEERAVFGTRKFYSLSLNMPNLNSAGGSWIIRFAALKPDAIPSEMPARAATDASASGPSSELSAPATTRKVDPAYPLELMKQNVGGTVILYGIIRTDGTVGNVRVLRSVDDRLDHFAAAAIAKWQFQPATKNGTPVDVEATFWIPFKPVKTNSNF
jgi:TonB family protein